MTANLAQLEAIQNQLNILKNQQQAINTSPYAQQVPYNSFPSSQNIQEMISKEVNNAIQQLIAPAQQEAQPQAQANPSDPNSMIIKTIDDFAQSILSKEQIKWLMDPTILNGLPLFFKSEKGKQAIHLLFSEYQDYVNR